NQGAHTFCSGLQEVPSGDWFCSPCQARRDATERRDAILMRACGGAANGGAASDGAIGGGSGGAGGGGSGVGRVRSREGGRVNAPNFWPRVLASATSSVTPRHIFAEVEADEEGDGDEEGAAGGGSE
ncbi:unnamed protein product, partial [Laminaria digitata]